MKQDPRRKVSDQFILPGFTRISPETSLVFGSRGSITKAQLFKMKRKTISSAGFAPFVQQAKRIAPLLMLDMSHPYRSPAIGIIPRSLSLPKSRTERRHVVKVALRIALPSPNDAFEQSQQPQQPQQLHENKPRDKITFEPIIGSEGKSIHRAKSYSNKATETLTGLQITRKSIPLKLSNPNRFPGKKSLTSRSNNFCGTKSTIRTLISSRTQYLGATLKPRPPRDLIELVQDTLFA